MRTIPTVHLERYETGENGTFGRLWIEGPDVADSLCLHTVEPEWLDNKPGKSCIPSGRYLLIRGMYHRGGYPTYELIGVPGRSLIKVHRMNWAWQSDGCIGLGMNRGELAGLPAVLSSKTAHDTFMSSMDGVEETWIYVTWKHQEKLRGESDD